MHETYSNYFNQTHAVTIITSTGLFCIDAWYDNNWLFLPQSSKRAKRVSLEFSPRSIPRPSAPTQRLSMSGHRLELVACQSFICWHNGIPKCTNRRDLFYDFYEMAAHATSNIAWLNWYVELVKSATTYRSGQYLFHESLSKLDQ
jgi:hypothetical protein